MNKPLYLELTILELSKIIIYKFWHDYVKPKYGEKSKLCYMGSDRFIVYIKTDDIYIKTDDIYKYIAEDVKNTIIFITI